VYQNRLTNSHFIPSKIQGVIICYTEAKVDWDTISSEAKIRMTQVAMLSINLSTLFSRRSIPWTGIGALFIAALLAKWTWLLFAPTTLAALPSKPDSSTATSAVLFGVAVAPSTAASALPNVHLIGLFSGSKGFAILKLDGNRQLGVALNEEVTKGNKLVEIGADFVVIDNNGLRQRVNLESKVASNPKPADPKPLPAVPPAAQAPQTTQAAQAVTEWNQSHQEMQTVKNVIP
jgi:hypothetical protein